MLGARPDGYHELDTVVQTIGLYDLVTVALGDGPPVTLRGPHAAGVPIDDTNLAVKALRALAARTGEPAGRWTITIEKRIPAAGGLGGGSADAAAVLRAFGRLWRVPESVLVEVAASVGSDEPALVLGGTVRARGRGERVVRLTPLPEHDVVLFLSPQTIERKTARMFAALDALPVDSGAVAARFAAQPPRRFESQDVANSFERVAFDVFPGLAARWEDIEARTGEAIRLSGAGPTLFWIGPAGQGARMASRAAGADCEAVVTSTEANPWTP
jgi:4-diphosphocytidyl-2-C-methyl-D-erythritol kinase